MTRVLVVDDDPQILRALRITLRAHGYQVLTAPNAITAMRMTTQEHPDVVVLDLGLPTRTASRSSNRCDGGRRSRSSSSPDGYRAGSRMTRATPIRSLDHFSPARSGEPIGDHPTQLRGFPHGAPSPLAGVAGRLILAMAQPR